MIEFLSRVFGGDKPEKPKAGKRINLALQGGGALGAFTWGVLDHLLEDGRLTVEGISGTSAGAVNAMMLADGLTRGGPDEARKRLAEFWRAASIGGDLPDVQRAVDRLFSFCRSKTPDGPGCRRGPVYLALRSQSPQHQSAEGSGRAFCRFRRRAGLQGPATFRAATNVKTGRLQYSRARKMTAD